MTRTESQFDPPHTANTLCSGIAIFAFLLAGSHQIQPAADPLRGWRTDPKTNALELMSVQETEKLTTFVLKNTSAQSITAFAVTHGNAAYTMDRFLTDTSIAPGESYSLNVATLDLAGKTRVIELSAVVFEDGTSAGAEKELENITAHRLGCALELQRVKTILDHASSLPPNSKDLEGLGNQIGRIPATLPEAIASLESARLEGVDVRTLNLGGGQRIAFLSAVRNTRQDAIQKVSQLERLPLSDPRMSRSPRLVYLDELRRVYGALNAKSERFLRTVRGGALR